MEHHGSQRVQQPRYGRVVECISPATPGIIVCVARGFRAATEDHLLSLPRSCPPSCGERGEGIKSCSDLNAALGGLRDVLKRFQDSSKLFEKYEVVCKSLGKEPTKFILDVETRWNSTFEMIEHLMQTKPILEDLLLRIRNQHDGFSGLPNDVLTCLQVPSESWDAADMYKTFLRLFKEATNLLSGSTYPTLGVAPLVYKCLMSHVDKHVNQAAMDVEQAEESALAAATAPSVGGDLDGNLSIEPVGSAAPVRTRTPAESAAFRRLQFFTGTQRKLDEYQDVTIPKEARLAVALDPRYKKLVPLGDRGILVDAFYASYRSRFAAHYAATTTGRDATLLSPPSKYANMLRMIQESLGVQESPPSRRSIEHEVSDWFIIAGMKFEATSRLVLDWFKHNAADYPRISLMARDYLSLPTTSVPSEQAFSRAGCTINERQSRLEDDSVQAICDL